MHCISESSFKAMCEEVRQEYSEKPGVWHYIEVGWCGQTCVWRILWPKLAKLFNYGHVDTTNLVERHWQFIKYIALRGRINWFIIGNLGQSLPQDAILVEEVDAASIAKHKNNMDHIIDRDLSNIFLASLSLDL